MSYSFKFAGNSDTVDETLQNDIGALNNIPVKKCAYLISSSLTFAAKLNSMSMESVVDELALDIAEKLDLKSKSLRRVLNSVLLFIAGAIKYNLSVTSVEADLQAFGLDTEHIAAFTKSWTTHYVKLNRSAVKSSLKFNEVVDMEWKFGVSASSDSAKKLGTTFLQLKLVIDKGNDKTEDVVMELSLKQFYEFLREMEKAKLSMQAAAE
eukprot:CAMPEP_0197038764 /NCGR_PEP_ID=MMETSP1384-20130603/15663_1 /TAXON_ID=29189 /ORGANISM="Ammonia sp." /LENGTH=208 /DNA_ID=CAMNT_0042469251 /DNA_START=11 /DNA_END=637 /DNA_ORIENTATION=-